MSKMIVFFLVAGILVQAQVGSNLNLDLFGDTSCCQYDEIEVSGSGSAFGQPDIAVLRVRFEVTEQSTEEAVDQLSVKTRGLVLVLSLNGYSLDDYETSSISVYPQRSYINGQSVITGYRASQSFTITIDNLDADGDRVASLIDQLAILDGIQIDSIQFDIEDKTGLQTEARANAFRDAEQKADDYASFAGVRLGRVISIVDGQFVEAAPIQARAQALSIQSDGPTTQIPVGEQEVSYRVQVRFSVNGLRF